MNKVVRFIVVFLCMAAFASVVFFGLLIAQKNSQEDVYYAAMEEYRELINADEPDIDQINNLADNGVYCDGYYGTVEEASKKYIRDIFVPYFSIQKLAKTSVFKDGITKEIIEAGQPEFTDALEVIDKMDNYLTVMYMAADSLFSEEVALDYLGAGLDEYYVDMFIVQVEELYANKSMQQDMFRYFDEMTNKSKAYKEALEFLKANTGSWHLDGDKVVFSTTALTNQYNQLLERVSQK